VWHPVLVALIGHALFDADQTYRPSFLDPYIPFLPLTKWLDVADQLGFEQKRHYHWRPVGTPLFRLYLQFPRQTEHQ
jgi:hypothetical protein